MQPDKESNTQAPLLLALDEAAAFIGIPSSTLHTWAWQGRVPCVRLGRRRFFRKMDLELWVERHLCPAKRLTSGRHQGDTPKRTLAHRKEVDNGRA